MTQIRKDRKRACAFILAAAIACMAALGACAKREPVASSEDETLSAAVTEVPSASPAPTAAPASPTPSPTPSASLEPTPSPTPTPAPTDPPLAIGESGSIGGMYFRVNGAHLDKDASGANDLWVPKEGHYFLFVDLEVRNDRTTPNVLSALITFRIQDQRGQTWGVTLGDEANALLDATLLPGQSVEGVAAFELPNDAKDNLTLIIKPDLIGTSLLCFDLQASMATSSEDVATPPSPTPGSLHVGDAVYGENWLFRVLETRYDAEGSPPFFTPPVGTVFYIVKLRVENLASVEQTMTSLLAFDLRDAEGKSYHTTVNPGIAQSLDGVVPPGGNLEGEITFIVPESETGFSLDIHPETLARESISIELQ